MREWLMDTKAFIYLRVGGGGGWGYKGAHKRPSSSPSDSWRAKKEAGTR